MNTPGPMLRRRSGAVATFDDVRGVGTVRGDTGPEIFFHCTAIADGTRTIDVGAEVDFDVVPGHLGAWEAETITPR